ncbi:hypothetical protein HGRIS_001129 [Hohenbuehelia grisea]|uniref:Uncharacterized protein n=1 Tax=Hohenbuehelia grisea TaxID=104357 RepID=A0ABR3JP34_9AGAR
MGAPKRKKEPSTKPPPTPATPEDHLHHQLILDPPPPPTGRQGLSTRATNLNRHPGDEHHRYTVKRRSRAEIQAAQQAEIAQKIARKQQTIHESQSKIERAAKLHSEFRQKQAYRDSVAMRPDLASSAKPMPPFQIEPPANQDGFGSEVESEDHMAKASRARYRSLSVIDGEGQGNDVDGNDESWQIGSDGDDSDPNYVLPDNGDNTSLDSDEDGDVEEEWDGDSDNVIQHRKTAKGKVQNKSRSNRIERGVLREQITAVQAQYSATTPAKRKTVEHEAQVGFNVAAVGNNPGPTAKRARGGVLGGLRADWEPGSTVDEFGIDDPIIHQPHRPYRSKSAASSTTSLASSDHRTPGEFQDDEDDEALHVARASKGPAHGTMRNNSVPRAAPEATTAEKAKKHSRKTSQMVQGLKIEQAPIADVLASSAKTKNRKTSQASYVNVDLPFPKDSFRAHLTKWREKVLVLLYDWAGTRAKPFGTNSDPDFEPAVKHFFCSVFPTLEGHKDHPAIIAVVSLPILALCAGVIVVGIGKTTI